LLHFPLVIAGGPQVPASTVYLMALSSLLLQVTAAV
jgi:hypothetical protein